MTAAISAQVGCRTLCGHPGCGQPIELVTPFVPSTATPPPYWMHAEPPTEGRDYDHLATPVEPDEAPVLPREAFESPERLVDVLLDAAEAHGFDVDRADSTRPALLHTARTLQYLAIPATIGGDVQ